MEIQELGSFITPTNKEEYCIGFVNGYLCVWAPELGPEESLVLVDDLPNNWGGDDDGDLEALINAAREMEACTTRKEPPEDADALRYQGCRHDIDSERAADIARLQEPEWG